MILKGLKLITLPGYGLSKTFTKSLKFTYISTADGPKLDHFL